MLIDQVSRQVHADEHHLEAADEKPQSQQPETGMHTGLTQRLAQALLMAMGRQRLVLDHRGQRYDQGHQ
ncbi:hypothetical protein D3C86_1852540 [compost metagenome]